MTPLKFFLNMKTWLETAETPAGMQDDDPFRDPDIRSMDLRQLADLPFPGISRGDVPCQKAPLAKCL